MKLKHLGIFGIISLMSYSAMVFLSPIAYPGYDWMSMAVSDLTARGAPSAELAEQLNALFGPCAVVSAMAVTVIAGECRSRLLRIGFGFFAAMVWITVVGYKLFPLVPSESSASISNVMHIAVTVLVVLFSIISLILIMSGAKKEPFPLIGRWAAGCFLAMLIGAIGTGVMPKQVFGLFERFSTFSAVIFNAAAGACLWLEQFPCQKNQNERNGQIC